MKLGLTEKQYISLLSLVVETELSEQPEPPPSEPEAGTSDQQGGGQGYPNVTKWESGVERGPANQIGVTKWSDVVGSKLQRGKANPLTEQVTSDDVMKGRFGINPKANTKLINSKYTDNFEKFVSPVSDNFYVPKGTKIISKYTNITLKMDNWEKDDQLKKWLPLNPTNPMSWKKLLPFIGNAIYSFRTPDNNVYTGVILNSILEEYRDKDINQFYKLTPDPTQWGFAGYFDNNGKKFSLSYWQNVGIYWSEVWEEHSTEIILMIGSVIAGLLTGGAADVGLLGAAAQTGAMTSVEGLTYRAFYTYVAEGLVWSGGGIYEISQGKSLSGVMDIAFATLLPCIHFKWGIFTGLEEFTEKEIADLSKTFAGKTSEELESVFNTLTNRQKEIFRRIQIIPKSEWEKGVKELYNRAGVKFEKMGIKPAEKMEETYLKIGNFIQNKWYLSLPASLTRDFAFLGLVENIFQKFKVQDTPKGEEAIKVTEKVYLANPDKKVATKEIIETIKKSKDVDGYINSINETLKNKFQSVPFDTTGDESELIKLRSKIKPIEQN
jgi:hypothetical protein